MRMLERLRGLAVAAGLLCAAAAAAAEPSFVPVFKEDFPDAFVLPYGSRFIAYSTNNGPNVPVALSSDHPIDMTRYQLANCYMGRAGLINSGGASSGESDLKEATQLATPLREASSPEGVEAQRREVGGEVEVAKGQRNVEPLPSRNDDGSLLIETKAVPAE